VLTGPDHLSALATLSANVRHLRQAFFLGIRWGIGHSTGLLVVAIVLIILSRPSNDEDAIDVPERLSTAFEALVGVFMIFLGLYGIRRAWTRRSDMYGVIPAVATPTTEVAQPSLPMYDVHSTTRIEDESSVSAQEIKEDPDAEAPGGDNSGPLVASRKPTCVDLFLKCTANVSAQTMALFVGIIHGLAGPGGVLGVIPAVQMHDGRLAALYLSCFCITSTVTMGVFATVYAACSSRLVDQQRQPFISGSYRAGVWEFRIECASACLSIIVGVLWLVLLSIGKLDDIFP
jgi:ABC-type nickel/cobalt efflux system permease component RcnA